MPEQFVCADCFYQTRFFSDILQIIIQTMLAVAGFSKKREPPKNIAESRQLRRWVGCRFCRCHARFDMSALNAFTQHAFSATFFNIIPRRILMRSRVFQQDRASAGHLRHSSCAVELVEDFFDVMFVFCRRFVICCRHQSRNLLPPLRPTDPC